MPGCVRSPQVIFCISTRFSAISHVRKTLFLMESSGLRMGIKKWHALYTYLVKLKNTSTCNVMKNFLLFLNLLILAGLAYIFSGAEDMNMKEEQTSAPETSPSADIVIVKEASYEKTAPIRTLPQAQEVDMNDLLADLDDTPIDQVVETFLTKTAESRIMDFEEGKAAQQKSAVDAIKDYGSIMVRDQSKMLADLRALAASKHITLPDTPDEHQQKALVDLQQEEGNSFDKKFIKMMIIDHKRDVKKFKKAAQSSDPDVRAFALKYLPVVESHLDDVQKLKK